MAKPRGLGKGIDALMQQSPADPPVTAPTLPDSTRVLLVPMAQVVPNPSQPRKRFDAERMEELTTSIRAHGIIQPIIAERLADGTFRVIAGERRLRAAQAANLREVPVVARSFSEQERLEVALIENIQREDLSDVEKARAYRKVLAQTQMSQLELADRLGVSRAAVTNTLRLLQLSQEIQREVENRTISAGHARALLSLGEESDRMRLLAIILGRDLSVREAERYAARFEQGKRSNKNMLKKQASEQRDPEVDATEERFRVALGTKVTIKGIATKGVVEISYYSLDDLNRLSKLIEGIDR